MYLFVKRLLDIICSLLAIIVFSPVMLLLCIIIKVDSKGPVLFKQKRIGRGKKPFYILKFRTMYVETPQDMATHMLKDPMSFITKVGKFLRKSSLDELPQVFNIFKGEMSIIGPRPALWNQYDLIAERDKYGVNDIRPGLSGWAQVNGRDELEIDYKARLDGDYKEKMCLSFDGIIFIRTITSVLKKEGVVEGEMKKSLEHSGQ